MRLAWYFKDQDRWFFGSQRNDKMMFSLACNITFTGYLKVLVLNVPGMGNTVFFEFESWLKDDIYWLLKSSWFGLWKALFLNFPEMGNTVFFLSHKVDGKVIFTWSFWAFQYVPGPGKYGFCAVYPVKMGSFSQKR